MRPYMMHGQKRPVRQVEISGVHEQSEDFAMNLTHSNAPCALRDLPGDLPFDCALDADAVVVAIGEVRFVSISTRCDWSVISYYITSFSSRL